MSVPAVNAAAPAPVRLRLDYLDGLRGIAALYVVVHHALMEIDYRYDGAGLPRPVVHATSWLIYGQIAVDVFIVLSGYCLMLPVARAADGALRGGAREFFKRRARRILPPYFAALAACLLLIGLWPEVKYLASVRWPGTGNVFTPHNLVSHLFLFHNLFVNDIHAIDYPMWSVATEWQIYFLFPLFLLPLWRRWGWLAAAVAGFGFGLACFEWLPSLRQACPWFVGLFGLGMAGATVGFSPDAGAARLRARLPWGIIAGVSAVIAYGLCKIPLPHVAIHGLLADTMVGLATVCFLVASTRALTAPGQFKAPWGFGWCASRGAVWLGTFSYSLYLIHAPVLGLVYDAAGHFTRSPLAVLCALWGIGVPLSVVVAYGFYRVFERPFMPGHPRSDAQAAHAAAASPAP